MSSREKNYYAEDWWLEFLEGELDPGFAKDMAILLNNSEADRQTLEGLALTRELVQASDDGSLPEDGHFYDLLHAKIMQGIRANPAGFATTGAVAEEEAKQNWAVIVDVLKKKREAETTV